MTSDFCKLTHTYGTYVESHLLPKALTRLSNDGDAYVEWGDGTRPIKRWSSWYDNSLVCRAGEDVLAALDNWAIPILRRHKLVWSGWEPGQLVLNDFQNVTSAKTEWRTVGPLDTKRIRLFFLSLLWRAAASDRPEFKEVSLPFEDLEKLRTTIVQGDTSSLTPYPITVSQMLSRGVPHNRTPKIHVLDRPKQHALGKRCLILSFRFYFDGLMVYFLFQGHEALDLEGLGPLIVGADDHIAVAGIPFDASLELTNIHSSMADALARWPNTLRHR